MHPHRHGELEVLRCADCAGIFLERADVGALSEAENDWHRGSVGHETMALPRITPDMMSAPPPKPRARAFIETLFG